FSRMVVDHVQNDLDARAMEGLDHALEFPYMAASNRRGGIANIGSKKADRIVAPVVGEASILQMFIVDELLNGEQLNGGHSQGKQMVDDGGGGQCSIGSTLRFRDVGVSGREALDVHFIDNCFVPGRLE